MKRKNNLNLTFVLFIIVAISSVMIFSSCNSNKTATIQTEYGLNKEADAGVPLNYDQIIAGVGVDKYDQMVSEIGQKNLDLLAYGAGVSNMIGLINIIDDVGKITELIMNGTNKLTVAQVIALLDLTDEAIIAESPPSEDTILKIATLINGTTDMNYLKDIIWGVEDFGGKTGMERLCLVVALLDETKNLMPTILNEVANTTEGLAVLLRIMNEILDLRTLTTVINETTSITNLTTIMNNLTNDGKKTGDIGNVFDGTDAMVATLNKVNEPSRLAYMINNLDEGASVSNDDGFETGTMTAQTWAMTGDQNWMPFDWRDFSTTSYEGNYSACIGLNLYSEGVYDYRNDMFDNDIASLEITADVITAGNVSFAKYVFSELNSDYLKFYIDDVLQDMQSGDPSEWLPVSKPVAIGVHNFRWEYVKDGSGSSTYDLACIDDIKIPGDRGASITPAIKAATILNQLNNIDSVQDTIADVFNAVDQNGLDNLIAMLNKVGFPLNYETVSANFIEVVNNLTSVDNLAGFINGLDSASVRYVTDLMDYVSDPAKMYDLINGLNGQPGEKMYLIVNGLTAAGGAALLKVMENVSLANLLLMVNNVTDTSDMPDIFNNLDLNGTNVTTPGGDSAPTAAKRMALVINDVADGTPNGMTVATHLVRLIDDMSGSTEGAANVGKMVSGLDNTVSPAGAVRMVSVMDALHTSDLGNRYDDPLCDGTTGAPTYPVTDYTNSLNYYIPDNNPGGVVSPIVVSNGITSIYKITLTVNISHTYDGDITLSLKSPAATIINISVKRGGSGNNYTATVFDDSSGTAISSGTAPFTGTYKPEGLLSLFNGQNSNGTWELKAVDDANNDTGSINSWTLHVTEEVTPPPTINCTTDKFGRLTTFMTDITGGGVAVAVRLINEVDSARMTNLTDLISTAKRIRYVTDVIGFLTNVDLMVDVLNDADMQSSTMRRLVDTMGDQTYPGRTAHSPQYTSWDSTDQGDGLGRLTTLMNTVVGAQGINNIIQLMNQISAAGYFDRLTGLIAGIKEDGSAQSAGGADRIHYMSDLITNLANINLLINVIIGPTGYPAAQYEPLVLLLNNIGASTRRGSLTKNVGEMQIMYGVLNELGYSGGAMRPPADQARMITLINDVVYCGIKATYDETVTYGPTCSNSAYSNKVDCVAHGATWSNESQFYACDSHVNFNYVPGSYAYDQRHRLSNYMLGMTNPTPIAYIVGDVTDTQKTVRIMNGTRKINTIAYTVDWMPGQVTAKLVNDTDIAAIYRAFVYMANNLDPDEREAAVGFASMIHFGTGIPDGTNHAGTCHYFTAIGPHRLAQMLNVDTGVTLNGIIQDFGWRSAIPAMVCGFGTPYAGTPQTLDRDYSGNPMPVAGSQSFNREETISIYDDPYYGSGVNYTHTYNAPWYYKETCNESWGGSCESGTGDYTIRKTTGCTAYIPEETTCLGASEVTDELVWSEGFDYLGMSMVDPGIEGVWDILKGDGFMGWLLSKGGSVGYPPAPKNFAKCRIDPETEPAVQYNKPYGQGQMKWNGSVPGPAGYPNYSNRSDTIYGNYTDY